MYIKEESPIINPIPFSQKSLNILKIQQTNVNSGQLFLSKDNEAK